MSTLLTEENSLLKKKINYLEKQLEIYKYDLLTGLLLRRDYELAFIDYNNSTEDIYLTIVDINRLHYTNNKFGYTAGDKLIINVANEIKKQFPKGDYFRIGGDEFAIFTKDKPNIDEIDQCVFAIANLKDYETKDDLMIYISKKLSSEKAKWYKKQEFDRRS